MRKVSIWMALLLLGGCAQYGPPLTELQERCRYETAPFAQSWPCLKGAMSESDYRRMPSDLRSQYLATGDVVLERIGSGKMTEAEGKREMADTLANINNSIASRQGSRNWGAPVICNRGAGGMLFCY